MMTPEIQNRKNDLEKELTKEIDRHRYLAELNQWTSTFLMFLAVGSSAVAGFGGLFSAASEVSQKLFSAIALLPAAIALIGTRLKFQQKALYHFRKEKELLGARHRLKYELPESPTADNVAAISELHRQITERTMKEWEKDTVLDFNIFKTT